MFKTKNEKFQLITKTDQGGKIINILRKDSIVEAKDNIRAIEKMANLSGFPVFKGQIKHLYESDFTGQKDHCPLCQGELVRMFSNYAYATQLASRLSTSPSGLFCKACPTVIIDDDSMRASLDSARFQYHGVFSVEDGYSKLSLLETYNGQTPTFILDEETGDIGGVFQSVNQPNDALYYDHKTGKLMDSQGHDDIIRIGGDDDDDFMPMGSDSFDTFANILPIQKVNALRKQKEKKKSKNKLAKQSKKANRKK